MSDKAEFSYTLLDGTPVEVKNQLVIPYLVNRWTLLVAAIISILIIIGKPYGFQNIAPIWMSVPLVVYMVFTVIIVFLSCSRFLNLAFDGFLGKPVRSIFVSSLAALVEILMMEGLMFLLVGDPISGFLEFFFKLIFSIITLEAGVSFHGYFLLPLISMEVEGRITPSRSGDLRIQEAVSDITHISAEIGEFSFKPEDILRMEAVNVYVSVHTHEGEVLARSNFAAAVNALPRVMGIQVHRSHWVAFHAVSSFSRRNGQPAIILKTGETVPVAKSRQALVEDTLLRLRDDTKE